jgi:hypothetical protein
VQYRVLALFGHAAMSDVSPEWAAKRTSLTSFLIDPAPASGVPNDGPGSKTLKRGGSCPHDADARVLLAPNQGQKLFVGQGQR